MWKGGVIADDEDIQTKLENGKRRIEEREREREKSPFGRFTTIVFKPDR